MRFQWWSGVDVMTWCTELRRRDGEFAVHLHCPWYRPGRLQSVWVTSLDLQHLDEVPAHKVPKDRWAEVLDATSWLEVSAILRR